MTRTLRKKQSFASQQNAKAVATLFLKIMQKYYQLRILGTLDMSGHFHEKRECQLEETLMFICMQKNGLEYLEYFLKA